MEVIMKYLKNYSKKEILTFSIFFPLFCFVGLVIGINAPHVIEGVGSFCYQHFYFFS